MADDNIKSFTINGLLIGLFLFSMVSAFVLLVNNEGRGEIFDGYPEISRLNTQLNSTYATGEPLEASNVNYNLSSNYNPELALSGADQSGNAININLSNLLRTTWNVLLVLGGFLFGSVFATISTVLMAIVGFSISYYFIKNVRTGS